MAITEKDFNITDRNTELPFFPSKDWGILAADVDSRADDLLPFNWLTAVYDPVLYDGANLLPALVVWDGVTYRPDKITPQCGLVYFPFSGAKLNIKGRFIMSNGVDARGLAITSTPIGTTEETDILEVRAEGGMY